MKLSFALLADAAAAMPDGKFSVQGGGIDNVSAQGFPAVHPMMALIVRLDVDEAEYGHDYHLRIEGVAPSDTPWLAPVLVPFKPEKPRTSTLPGRALFVVNIPMLLFPAPGTYTFRLSLEEGNKLLGKVPLELILVAELTEPGTNTKPPQEPKG